MKKNEFLLQKALSLLKAPMKTPTPVVRTVEITPEGEACEREDYRARTLGKGDTVVLDFGNHFVGYLTLRLGAVGSHPDAPVKLGFSFAERPEELLEKAENYRGWISASWIQQEQIHVDVLPGNVRLPRRYAFRFVKIEVLAVSDKYRLTVENAFAETVTSANDAALSPYQTENALDARLDAVACRTLRSCMQTVFEDGPKRDRRLWLGDLRLQALANYRTYRDNDLVKECLYLFAALPLPNGRLPACVFLEPEPAPDDTEMFDYALLFVSALEDYVNETGDEEALEDLYPTAVKQLLLAEKDLGEDGIVKDSDRLGWCFIDWKLDLNKQAAAQGVLLYALKSGIALAKRMGDGENARHFSKVYTECADAAMNVLWDENEGLFVSGKDRQLSAASAIWLLLGLSLDDTKGRAILRRLEDRDLVSGITTPYLYHHYIEALLRCGEKEKALSVLRGYWGGMAESGADTFWELYDPKDPKASPYGGAVVNSYCHAWSCAPAYFLRKLFS